MRNTTVINMTNHLNINTSGKVIKWCPKCNSFQPIIGFTNKETCKLCQEVEDFNKTKRIERIETQKQIQKEKRLLKKQKRPPKKKKKKKFTKKNKSSTTNTLVKKRRQDLLVHRQHICEICKIPVKETKYLHMHHIDRNRSNNSDSNLLLLCPTCHKNQHLDNCWVTNALSYHEKEWKQTKDKHTSI